MNLGIPNGLTSLGRVTSGRIVMLVGNGIWSTTYACTDLAVRLTYADIQHELVHNMMDAVLACPEGRVEVLANYTAFRDLKRALVRRIEAETH